MFLSHSRTVFKFGHKLHSHGCIIASRLFLSFSLRGEGEIWMGEKFIISFPGVSRAYSVTPMPFRAEGVGGFYDIYCKISKISPGAYIFQRPMLRGLVLEGLIFGGAYLWREICRFKVDWASLIVGRKFTVFALIYYAFEGNFQVQGPRGLIFGEFFALQVWGAHIWRGLYMEGIIFGILRYKFYSWLPTTPTFKGNRKTFELSAVQSK